MNDDVRELAKALAPETSAGDDCYVRRGAVTAVSRAANTYTLSVGGGSIASVPAYSHIYAFVGSTVDVLFDKGSPVVIGIVGAIGALITPTLINGWTQTDSVNYPVGYYRMTDGTVVLRGLLTPGTYGSAAFTLPTNYRPATELIMPAKSQTTTTNVFGDLRIAVNGNVLPASGGTSWFSLDGSRFQAI